MQCSAVLHKKTMFQVNISPPSSGLKSTLANKHQSTFKGLHDITSPEDRTPHSSAVRTSVPTKSTDDPQFYQKLNKLIF